LKRKITSAPEKYKTLSNAEQSEGQLSPVHIKDTHLLLEYWVARIAEARATMARALNIDSQGQNEGLLSPTYITDSHLLLEYWAARSGEARARMEESLALASLSINMDIALRESNDMLRRLEAALEYSPKAKSKLMNGELF
jgi:hypothetical protein